ncbi:MAG: efflux RND transporter periplasmic adaptor subunit [Nitrosomonadales bacterium]|nr:efflux RND transporter periplasmic adaptor subunit [Nitrosomonadales bacterium]
MNNKYNHLIFKIALPGLALASGAILPAGSSQAEPAATAISRPALTVRTTTLREDKWARTLSANGSVIPWQEATVGAEISGLRIAEVNVSVGDHVERGDVLATLAAETIQAGEAEALASLKESEAVQIDAKANAERARKLSASGFVSDQQATQSATSELTAQAKVEVQRARHQSALLRLSQTRIVAPDSGVISAANANVGSLSQPGVELFRLIRKGRLEWRADLTAEELMLIRKGMAAEVAVGEGNIFKGTVRAISPSVNPQTRYGYALVMLPESTGIVAGAYARGTFDVSGRKKTLLSLPQSAVMQRGSKTYVLIVGPDNRIHEREVTIGQRNGDRIEIRQGLKENEQAVESGGPFLTEGDVVMVVKG